MNMAPSGLSRIAPKCFTPSSPMAYVCVHVHAPIHPFLLKTLEDN